MPVRPARRQPGGVLIAVEGCDGSGKSTQLQLLYHYLKTKGFPVHLTSWNSSPAVHPLIRRGKRSQRLCATSYALVHAADFSDRHEREILPRLELGQIVLCDRYVGTALARDGARGMDPAWTRGLYAQARPADLTFFFHAPIEVSAGRLVANRHGFTYYEAGLDLGLSEDPLESFMMFQGRVLRRYEEIEPELGYVRIDSRQSLRVQQREVRRLVLELLGRTKEAVGR